MSHGSLGALENVVCTLFLVGGDEVRVVDAGEWLHPRHFLLNKVLQRRLEHLSTVHSLGKVHAANVPPSDYKIVGVDHGKDFVERDIDLLAGLGFRTEFHGGSHDHGAIVIGSTRTLAGVPCQALTVGNDACRDGGTVVPTPSHQHHTDLADFAVNLEVVDSLFGSRHIFAVTCRRDIGGAVGIFGLDLIVGIHYVWGVDGEEIFLGSAGGGMANPVGVTIDLCSVWCHAP